MNGALHTVALLLATLVVLAIFPLTVAAWTKWSTPDEEGWWNGAAVQVGGEVQNDHFTCLSYKGKTWVGWPWSVDWSSGWLRRYVDGAPYTVWYHFFDDQTFNYWDNPLLFDVPDNTDAVYGRARIRVYFWWLSDVYTAERYLDAVDPPYEPAIEFPGE